MSHTVHKIAFDLSTDRYEIELPLDAEPLHVAAQHGELCLWYRWNQEVTAMVRHQFVIVGTGFPCPSALDGEYLGTALFGDGALVLHLFRKRP